MKEMAQEKGKRNNQRWLGMEDFSISTRQKPYLVIKDLNTRKVDITIGQLVVMIPKAKRDLWWRLSAHHIKPQEKEVHSIKAEIDSSALLVEVVCKGIPLNGVYVNGGTRMNVMMIATMETFGLWCDHQSKYNLRMA